MGEKRLGEIHVGEWKCAICHAREIIAVCLAVPEEFLEDDHVVFFQLHVVFRAWCECLQDAVLPQQRGGGGREGWRVKCERRRLFPGRFEDIGAGLQEIRH